MTIRTTFSSDEDQLSFWSAIEDLPLVLVYKHSTRCFASTSARSRMEDLAALRPDLPILQVDVIAERELSQEISRRLGVVHESPQAILVREGRPVWHTSHSGVTVEAVTRQL
jgi:bacillithiol system protein YtxJ